MMEFSIELLIQLLCPSNTTKKHGKSCRLWTRLLLPLLRPISITKQPPTPYSIKSPRRASRRRSVGRQSNCIECCCLGQISSRGYQSNRWCPPALHTNRKARQFVHEAAEEVAQKNGPLGLLIPFNERTGRTMTVVGSCCRNMFQ